jgi:hypothetical protein
VLAPRPRTTRAAALAAALVTATPLLAGAAGAATTTTPAVGASGASITVLRVESAAASIRALTASLAASTAANPDTASITVSPVWSSATGDVGAVTVTPADSPKHVGAGSVALPSGLASLASPAVDVVATVANGTAIAGVTGNALGTITVLGTPLSVGSGALDLSSKVTKTYASSEKSVSVSQLALPTVLDLLAGLGLDVGKLTQDQLMGLFNVVKASLSATVNSTVASLNTAVDTAQTAVGSGAAQTIAAAQAALTSQQATLASAQSALTSAQSNLSAAFATINANLGAINALIPLTPLSPVTAQSWASVTPTQRTAIDTITGVLSTPVTSAGVDALVTAVTAAQAAVAAAQALVDAAQALLNALLALLNAITDALDSNPLAALGGISAGTSAIAGTVGTAEGHLTVGTVDILGVGTAPAQLTSALSTVTSALSSVLNGITGVTFTPPTISIGAIDKTTSKAGKTANAAVTVAGLKIGLPTLQLPTALALPGAANIPGVDLVNGVLSSLAGTVTIAELRDSATFTQGASSTTGGGGTPTGGGSLPTTGAPAALAVAALMAMGLGLALRRRARHSAE